MTPKIAVVKSMAWSLLIAISLQGCEERQSLRSSSSHQLDENEVLIATSSTTSLATTTTTTIVATTTTITTTKPCGSYDIDCRVRALNCSQSNFPLSFAPFGDPRFLLGEARRSRDFAEHGADPFFYRPSEDDPTGLNMMEMSSPKPFRSFRADINEHIHYAQLWGGSSMNSASRSGKPWKNVWGELLESVFHQFDSGYYGEDQHIDFTNSSALENRLQDVVETMAKSKVSTIETDYEVLYRVGHAEKTTGLSVDLAQFQNTGCSGSPCWEFTTDFKETIAALPELDCDYKQCALPEVWRLFFKDYGTHAPTHVSFGESNSVFIVALFPEESRIFDFTKSGPRNRDFGALGLCSNPPPSSATLRPWPAFLGSRGIPFGQNLTMPSWQSFRTAIRTFNFQEPRSDPNAQGQLLTPVQEPAWS